MIKVLNFWSIILITSLYNIIYIELRACHFLQCCCIDVLLAGLAVDCLISITKTKPKIWSFIRRNFLRPRHSPSRAPCHPVFGLPFRRCQEPANPKSWCAQDRRLAGVCACLDNMLNTFLCARSGRARTCILLSAVSLLVPTTNNQIPAPISQLPTAIDCCWCLAWNQISTETTFGPKQKLSAVVDLVRCWCVLFSPWIMQKDSRLWLVLVACWLSETIDPLTVVVYTGKTGCLGVWMALECNSRRCQTIRKLINITH